MCKYCYNEIIIVYNISEMRCCSTHIYCATTMERKPTFGKFQTLVYFNYWLLYRIYCTGVPRACSDLKPLVKLLKPQSRPSNALEQHV